MGRKPQMPRGPYLDRYVPPVEFVGRSPHRLDNMSARELLQLLADRLTVRAEIYSKLGPTLSAEHERECGIKASEVLFIADELRAILVGGKALSEIVL